MNTITAGIIGGAAVILAAAVGTAALRSGPASTGAPDARPDCPGKITCALTGDQVCADQCPLIDHTRTDCPGKVECPLTGELVCRDRCPVQQKQAAAAATEPAQLPPCCAGAK